MLEQEINETEGCIICTKLLVEPTTLVCGHTFCRHCLAKWTVSSGKRLCPTCNAEWTGSPKVNILIRSMLENAHAEKLKERAEEVDTAEYKSVIAKFESMNESEQEALGSLEHGGDRNNGGQNNTQRWTKYLSHGVTLVICLVAFILNTGQRELTDTPVKEWNTDDVTQWMGQLGSWAKRYSDTIRNNDIDGKMLLMLKRCGTMETLNFTDGLHRKVFLQEIAHLETIKQPENFWEYKSKFPFRSLFLLLGFTISPRLTIVYLYLFEYRTVYTPFMRGGFSESPIFKLRELDSTFSRIFYTVLMPYRLVGIFANTWSSVHFYISKYVYLLSIAATIKDVCWMQSIVRNQLTRKDIQKYVGCIRNGTVALALSALLPWLVYECVFYINFLCLPVEYFLDAYPILRNY